MKFPECVYVGRADEDEDGDEDEGTSVDPCFLEVMNPESRVLRRGECYAEYVLKRVFEVQHVPVTGKGK